MYTLTVENEYNEQLELTSCDVCEVLKVDGLNPPAASINTTAIAGVDGATFNSARIEPRNIVILLNIKPPIESNRQKLYKYFRVKRWCRLHYKNDARNVYIDGYTESFENDFFTISQQPQISIICPDPSFKEETNDYIQFSSKVVKFQFPFSIPDEGIEFGTIEKSGTKLIDAGEVETGGIISFTATANEVLNPIIYNRTTQKYFGLNFDMSSGDIITVNTKQGEKSVTLLRGGVTTNIIDKIKEGSSWIKFIPGENEISYGSDEGQTNLIASVTLTNQFEGV